MSPTSTEHVEPRVIMASADGEIYKKVIITLARTGDAVRELVFAAVSALVLMSDSFCSNLISPISFK